MRSSYIAACYEAARWIADAMDVSTDGEDAEGLLLTADLLIAISNDLAAIAQAASDNYHRADDYGDERGAKANRVAWRQAGCIADVLADIAAEVQLNATRATDAR